MTEDFDRQHQKRPPQSQSRQPGREYEMQPRPVYIRDNYRGSGKLRDKVALITGGDSGIGRAVSVHFAREGADIALVYLEEDRDAQKTAGLVEAEGRRCVLLRGDIRDSAFCGHCVAETEDQLGRLDILVNNAAEQHPREAPEEIDDEQLRDTFATNLFSYHYFTRAALKVLRDGGVILNTTSVTAYRGSDHLIDYSSTKGAIVSYTRSLAMAVAGRGLRVNAVAPGPIWTPLIPATFGADRVEDFGGDTPLGRAGQPCEVATCFVFLASEDASYLTGQVIHPNGGGFIET
ncbi:SDR family oxidoreductase [Microbulbifer halophilus]|uniref:SDR family oxidoreductase n=1 Tax=Microbulbifer halophilus TaxID=453963 RepID=A0ABW5EFY4_9GAMM|nr:SDR family oxidoreductase [Microbulbifer halophilus]MCW8127310.1 SDR family oxidoreductase [Microbulbifer halophilus]